MLPALNIPMLPEPQPLDYALKNVRTDAGIWEMLEELRTAASFWLWTFDDT